MGLLRRITRFLDATSFSLIVAAINHYMSFIFSWAVFAGTAPSNPGGQFENFGVTTKAEVWSVQGWVNRAALGH